MNSTFLIAACIIAVAAAAPLMITLLGRRQTTDSEREARRARSALAAARAADVISQAEYDSKLAALPPADNAATPVAGRMALAVAVLLPAAALALYAEFGDTRALDPANHVASATTSADAQQAPDLATALAGLEQRLAANPEDAEGWALLARGYQSSQQFEKALAAMRKVRELAPDDLDAQVGYAEALALSAPGRSIGGESADLIEDALRRDPTHQRALWLAGIAGMQRGDSATALKHWRTLEALLPEGSEIRATLGEQIRNAESPNNPASAEPAAVAANEPTATPTPAASAASVTVSIRLDPALQDKVSASDTLFVFARAANGPRMPLAIQRLSAGDLPVTVTLDDSTSMMPTMKLSQFPDIVIGARISKTGNATPASGDLQALTEAMNQSAIKDHVQITIDEVLP